MESSSTNAPLLCQNERKLKQATLSFGILKHDSPSCKKQKLELDGTDSSSVPPNKDVQIGEASCETSVKGEMQNVASDNLTNDETSEGDISEMKCVNEAVCTKNCLSEIEFKGDKQGIGSFSDKITTVSPEITEVECIIRKHESSSVSVNEDTSQNNKRKLMSDEQLKGQKPPKRVKLIYNIDKLKKFEYKPSESKVDSASNCKNVNHGRDNSVVQSKSECSVGEDQKSDVLIIRPGSEDRIDDLPSNCSTESVNLKDKTPVEKLETSGDVKLSVESCVTPNMKKKNSLSSGKSSEKGLTPKQLERKAELAKKREERELLQQEKERKKREMKEEKDRLKQEKEEEKKKLKEEKEKKRQAEIELKNEEKRKKEEEKRKKEEQKLEEKRKKEEQKLEDKRKREERKKEEEEELSKKKFTKEAAVFSSFFKKYDIKAAPCADGEKSSGEVVFMPFTVKVDMRLAPINRNPMDDGRRSKFEENFIAQSNIETYLTELRSGALVPRKSANTWPLEEKYDEVVVLDEGLDLKDEVTTIPQKRYNDRRPKLLQFHENRRPPYWGTWRKKSKMIRPKNPLGKDEIFDYDVDSDDEWEEEEPGESLHGSDDEKESEDEYEVDNDFFVPHGYLSDDENPEEEMISPETQKAKLKLLGEQFDMERNEKTKLLKPITIGCIWFKSESDEPATANPSVIKFLNKRKAIPWTDNIPIPLVQDENTDPNEGIVSDGGTPTSAKKVDFPKAAIPDLITLVHGSTNSRKNLAKAFLVQWNKKEEDKISGDEGSTAMLSQARIAKKIKELGKWEEFPEEGPYHGKWCWYVKKEIREKFSVVTMPIASKIEEIPDVKDTDMSKKASPTLITKFTKILTEDERRNQITNVRKSMSTPKPLSEFTPNSPKSQVPTMKSVRKLQQFWAKPSLSSKYSPGLSVESMDVDVQLIDSPSTKEDNVQDKEIEKSDGDKSGDDDIEEIFPVYCRGDETKPNEVSADTEGKSESREENFASQNGGNVDKMDVSDTEADLGGGESVKEVSPVSSTTGEKGAEVLQTSAPASDGQPPENRTQERCNNALNVGSEEVDRTCSASIQNNGKDSPGVNESRPVVKKRVAILFSAPRGCDIVKPNILPKKLTPCLDDVVKKYESTGAEGEKAE